MRIRLVGGIAALVIALGALAFPSAEPAQAGSTCTGWKNSLVPPTSIRVYRTAKKRTETVPFRTYVEKVMAAEWGSTAPAAALRVGAIAAKQFGWYYAIVWRGGKDAAGRCYDVRDSSVDQIYDPSRTPAASIRAAVAATWRISLRKSDRLFLTGYRPGTGSCTAHVDGWKLYQRDAVDCVRRYADTTERLARRFFSNIFYATPGAGDYTGDGRGDAAVLTTAPDTGETTARVYTSDAAYKSAVAAGSLDGAALTSVAPDQLLGRAAGDVDGDGRSDVVQLVQTADGVALEVMKGSSAGLAVAKRWWSDASDPSTLGSGTWRLLVADFTGDGRADAGLLRIRPGATPSTSVYLAASGGTSFGKVKRTWTRPADMTPAEFRAGDTNGDGRADLLVLVPLEAGGTGLQVALASSTFALGSPTTWGTEYLPLASIRALVGDVTRDGRDDLIVVRKTGADSIRIVVYRSLTSATFSRLHFTATLPLSFAGSRFTAADLTGDARVDLLALVDRGVDADGNALGSVGWRLVAGDAAFTAATWFTDAAMPWGISYPY